MRRTRHTSSSKLNDRLLGRCGRGLGVAVGLQRAHRSQRRFSQRTTGLPWNLTFTDAAKKVSDCDSGRSRMPTDDRDNLGAERLHPMVTNQRCRPVGETRSSTLAVAKRSLILYADLRVLGDTAES